MKKLFYLSLFLLSACGTVFSGTTQDLSIDSNVKDVSVYLDGAFVCKTPCIYPVERASGSISVVGKKKGYEDVGMAVKTKINPVAWANLIMPYSWTTDIISGGAWKYRQDGVYLNMEPVNMKQAEALQFKKDSTVRRFSLMNYGELKIEATKKYPDEYLTALSELSGQKVETLVDVINSSPDEVSLAHKLTAIR